MGFDPEGEKGAASEDGIRLDLLHSPGTRWVQTQVLPCGGQYSADPTAPRPTDPEVSWLELLWLSCSGEVQTPVNDNLIMEPEPD